MSRLTVVAALEAIEAGDVDLAAAILRGAVARDEPMKRVYVCDHCRTVFRWPGQLDDHVRNVHGAWAA